MKRQDIYQISLIALAILATLLASVFLYREIFPEYKIYQNAYIALEEFRSTYTGEPPAPFKTGIAQIVITRPDKGPETIDRCISCHVALKLPHFSQTIISLDEKGNPILNDQGLPVYKKNPDYIWDKLDEKIADLKLNNQLKEAEHLESLKTAHVNDNIYDMRKVLIMHPLIGNETRPLENHPMETFGCVSCHNGNGRGLTTEKAHGPIFDNTYEISFEGPKPVFTESDPNNDPLISSQFNHKPGDALLFQTTPLFIGPLMQAKCVQCHQPQNTQLLKSNGITSNTIALEGNKNLLSNSYHFGKDSSKSSSVQIIDSLTQNYQRGEQLFISQACYACHRITGLTRGGIGPELTQAGLNYPWYLKESIVWPQADLKTSTMPNFMLDHEEVQDLLTFLLGQTGKPKVKSEIETFIAAKEWETGGKKSWEQPLTPDQLREIKPAMIVFATEGCAACHRLKGFESNVGFAVESQKPTLTQLEAERDWFSHLIPENIIGSQLVKALENNAEEIDQRIQPNIRKESLLEEIDQLFPDAIASLYTPFKYAARAKDYYYAELLKSENDSERQLAIQKEAQVWKDRVQNVLMMYVQEYGLGRLIGPRLNWSGIFRSDEWLMEHFWNPSGHSPRSIMPVFPFDNTKFYALTKMLDALAQKNTTSLRTLWNEEGFSPDRAYHIHCAQCHGDSLHGNGPVAEWIYPIPKNLRNADFLRNLTYEQAINSIEHGVKGTPMPPWGEVAFDKEKIDGEPIRPVLSKLQIEQMVDWLFAGLPGSQVIKHSTEVPKWHYQVEDVVQDLKREGTKGLFEKNKKELEVNDFFNKKTLPNEENQDNSKIDEFYYIKPEFYTEQNLKAGEEFFVLNCAVCHGKEAEGSGTRSETMTEAKPRMLTNLDWLETRDDLRLIRSIKYGVPGTAMTPWGDLTTSLIRMQLVAYIRHLSEGIKYRGQLMTTLYQVFETGIHTINEVRAEHYPKLKNLQDQYEQLVKQREELQEKTTQDKSIATEALKIYEQELSTLSQLTVMKKEDQLYEDLKLEIQRENNLYRSIGDGITNLMEPQLLETYLELITLNQGRYHNDHGNLTMNQSNENLSNEFEQKLIQLIDQKINLLKNKSETENLQEVNSLNILKKKIIDGLKQAKDSIDKQKEIFSKLNSATQQ